MSVLSLPCTTARVSERGAYVLREMSFISRVKLDHEGRPFPLNGRVRRPIDAAALLIRLLEREPIEVFGVLCLSTTGHIEGWHEVSRGGLDRASAHPREVFRPAFVPGAARLICAHNHPSGDPTPSADDLALARRLVDAGRLLDVPILDHFIIGRNAIVSLRPRSRRRDSPFQAFRVVRRPD